MNTVDQAHAILKKKISSFPETLLVLGSGWNKIIDEMTIEQRISYKELFGIETSVAGHVGELIVGAVHKKRIACMSGRFHMYEGYSGYDVTIPIRLFAKVGIKNLILTAA